MGVDPQRYAELFRTESREQLSAINRALLQLEEGGATSERVASIFRAVHTIKGMSATMGYHAVAEFSHEVESLLDKVRRGDQSVSADLLDALFFATDALEQGVDLASEEAGQSVAMTRALQRLHDLAGGSATSEFRVVLATLDDSADPADPADRTEEHDSLEGPGVIVRVRQAAVTSLPGVRAFMVVQRLRALGDVAALNPPIDTLQASETPQSFAVRLVTTASVAEIEAAVRAAGDIEHVEVDTSGRTRRGRAAAETLAAPADATAPATRPTRHVRIDLARLDVLMNLIGELVITRGRILQLTAGNDDPALDESLQQASRLIGDLQTEIMTSRMVPVWQVFDRFPRLVRDAARQLGKDVGFVVSGKEIEIDRSLLDEIGEPVVHLLRNAIDHGIESPEAREAAGKPRSGRLELSAARDRAAVLIRVSDDGRGIDRKRVLARAKEIGLVGGDAVDLDDDLLFRCIAHPGFSTKEQVSDLSGRGVGIDVVQSKTRALGGTVELRTADGEGTTVTIRLPVTLAIVRALLARAGNERYALPLTHVRETLEFSADAVQRVQGREVLVLRGEVLPLLDLRRLVQQTATTAGFREIVVIERGDRRAGLVVDELIGQQEIVVKQFDAARDALALFSGATILSDGAPALIVDVGSLL